METGAVDLQDLLRRVRRVELQNTRLTILGVASTALLAGALILTHVTRFDGVVHAGALKVWDDQIARIQTVNDSDGIGLVIADSSGKPLVLLAERGNKGVLEFRDASGNSLLTLP